MAVHKHTALLLKFPAAMHRKPICRSQLLLVRILLIQLRLTGPVQGLTGGWIFLQIRISAPSAIKILITLLQQLLLQDSAQGSHFSRTPLITGGFGTALPGPILRQVLIFPTA